MHGRSRLMISAVAVTLLAAPAASGDVARATGRAAGQASTVVGHEERSAPEIAGTLAAAAAPSGAAAPMVTDPADTAAPPTSLAAVRDVAIGAPPLAPPRPAPTTTSPPVTVDPADVITRPTLPPDVAPSPPAVPSPSSPDGPVHVALIGPPLVAVAPGATGGALAGGPTVLTLPETR